MFPFPFIFPSQFQTLFSHPLNTRADCTLLLLSPLRALRLRRLRNVTLVGFVCGAAYVEHCSSCSLHIAAAQVRIHDSDGVSFALRVRSRPIVERTRGAIFSPLLLPAVPGQEEGSSPCDTLLAACLLDEPHRPAWDGMWGRVDDFGWIKAAHSPNWASAGATDWPVAPVGEA